MIGLNPMNKQLRAFSAFGALASAIFMLGAASVSDSPVPKDAALITNAGTGDYAGFRIVVERSGHAAAVDGAGRASSELRSDVVDQFFQDLTAATPIANRNTRPCDAGTDLSMKSNEINASIDISWNGKSWSRLRCISDARAGRLMADATAIQRALYVQAYRQRPALLYVVNGANYYAYNKAQGTGDYNSYPGNFSNGGFNAGYFNAGRQLTTNPYSGSLPTSSLTGTSPFIGFPGTTMPFTNPYTGLPGGSLPYATPYGGLPATGLPVTSPYSGGP